MSAPDVDELLMSVPDPELPFLSIVDLGIVRGWHAHGDRVRVQLTPTYSGCPAMDTIRDDVEKVLRDSGFRDVSLETVLSPPWTTEWLSDRAREALGDNGIAPPPVLIPLTDLSERQHALASSASDSAGGPACPLCGSSDTEELSRFGSTACKGMWRCLSCREPFDHFKAH